MKNTKMGNLYVLAQMRFKVTYVLALLGNLCLGSSHLVFITSLALLGIITS
jgi:hypothetical protein